MQSNMSQAEMLKYLRDKLGDSLAVADLQFSLLVAALSSYKHDTVVRPFPPMFRRPTQDGAIQDDRDFKRLENEVDKIPSFDNLLKKDLKPLEGTQGLDLLHWCLNRNAYTLKICQPDKILEIREKTKQNTPTPNPNVIFEVVHSRENDQKFRDLRGDSKLLYGYHGSNIENFHSILNYGLQGHMSKNALFGEGTYLSSELAISLQYSPHGRGWANSMHGDSLSCVAVCEMIDDPSVKCQTKETKRQLSRSGSRSKIAGSEGGEIPETYYVVRNNEMIRVKYLLLYVVKARKRSPSPSSWGWFQQHKFAVVMMSYALLLVIIAVYNSKAWAGFSRRMGYR